MTIAIGYHCYKGVIVAADTCVIIGNQKQEGSKLDFMQTDNAAIAIVNASTDGNATATLIRDAFFDISAAASDGKLLTLRDFEKLMKARMEEWRRGYGAKKSPGMQFIAAARIGGTGAALYFCEPPNTVKEIDNYVAIGTGADVTDPLQHTLFENLGGEFTDVHLVLRRIAYLIHRAKADNIYCGKNTGCAIVGSKLKGGPILVDHADIQRAEDIMRDLDVFLSSAAMFAIDSVEANIQLHSEQLADMLRTSIKELRLIKFHDDYGDEITL